MITWQQLRYGTLVIAGVAVTGTTIYTSTRRTVKPQDIVELTEAIEERYRMAFAEQAPPSLVSTQAVAVWTNTVYEYAVPDGTNAPIARPFLEYDGTTNLVTTNTQVVATSFAWTDTFTINTGMFVWAGWTNITATNFDTAAANADYTLAGYTDAGTDADSQGWIGYYTNSTPALSNATVWILRDIQNRDHAAAGANGGGARGWILNAAVVPTSNAPPWQWTYPRDSFTSPTAALFYYPRFWTNQSLIGTTNWWKQNPVGADFVTGLVTVAGLDTNAVRSAAAVYRERRINALARYVPDAGYWDKFDTALTNIVTNFVARFDVTNGVPVYHSVTGLFATLQIGDGTNRFTKTVTNGVPVYGGVGRALNLTNLVERYRVLQCLTSTVVSSSWADTIVSNGVSNVVYEVFAADSADLPLQVDVPFLMTDVFNHKYPSPWWDAYIGEIPSWWLKEAGSRMSADITGYFSNVTFNGSLRGAITVVTNTTVPRFEDQFTLAYAYDQDVWARADYAVSDPAWSNNFYIISWSRSQAGSVNNDSMVYARGRLRYVVNADLTGVTHRAVAYLRAMDRTNNQSAAYFSTGLWYEADSTNVLQTAMPQTNVMAYLGVGNTMSSTNFAPTMGGADNSASECGGGFTYCTYRLMGADINGSGYAGRILTNQVVILNWVPTRAVP